MGNQNGNLGLMHKALKGRGRSASGVMLSAAKYPRSLWLVLSAKTTAEILRPPESTAGSG
jgi:hypothetical protein